MRFIRTTAAAAAWLALLAAHPAAAQIDYRNLDDGRPVTTEDAYPVERYAFELLAPYHFESERGGRDFHSVTPELAYGLAANAQVGITAALAAIDAAAGTDWGLAGVRLFALYNFNTETPALPAFAFRADWAIPAGSLAGDAHRVTLKGIATRSWGRTRAHLNAAVSLGSDAGLGPVDAAPRWRASLAADRTFLRKSLLAVGELLVQRTVTGAPAQANVAGGIRWQWTATLVLDAGLSRRLTSDGPDFALTFGLSHAFAVRGLLPGGAR
jgi:hypothetical protein